MSSPDFQQSFFELFSMSPGFDLDQGELGERYRALQQEMHPDRFAAGTPREQRLAVQFSAHVNQAYATLRRPLSRALYLLELAGMDREQVAGHEVDGSFLIEQMELREKLEATRTAVEPEAALDHLVTEITADLEAHREEFALAWAANDMDAAAAACVKMQYLDKLQAEAEELESELLEG